MECKIETKNSFLIPFTSKLPDPPKENIHICAICASTAIYKCPKCSSRTCSSKCSKTHKEENNCDGQRPIPNVSINDQQTWQKIQGYSNYNEDITSIEDQKFLYNIRQRKINSVNEIKDLSNEKSENALVNKNLQNLENTNKYKLSHADNSLLRSAQFRRIWILPSNNSSKGFDSSRIEQFSDTIFWKCTIKFACRPLIEQNDETVEPSENVSFKKVKSLVDYELEEEEELKDSDDIVDNMNKKMEEEGEILSVQHNEEKQLIDDQNNCNKVDIDVCPNHDSLSSLKWLSYTVQNIPESIRVCTLLRQFLCPKPYGTVIQKSQLNMDFLQPFILASKQIINPPNNSDKNKDFGSSQLNIYSEVALPLGNEDDEIKSENDCQSDAELRYYPVNPQQTILDNLRNRYIVGHPCFVVLLRRENEFGEFEFPTMGEAEQALLNAERERIVTIKDRPMWQNRNGNGGGRGFRGGQFNNKSRQHGRNGGRRGGQQHMTEHNNRPSMPPNGQWQQQPSNGPIYNNYSSSNNQHHQYHHFHPYMPSTFVPQAPYPNQGISRWNGQGGGNRGNEFRR